MVGEATRPVDGAVDQQQVLHALLDQHLGRQPTGLTDADDRDPTAMAQQMLRADARQRDVVAVEAGAPADLAGRRWDARAQHA